VLMVHQLLRERESKNLSKSNLRPTVESLQIFACNLSLRPRLYLNFYG
jgi:hypothetical protein